MKQKRKLNKNKKVTEDSKNENTILETASRPKVAKETIGDFEPF